MIDLHSYDYYVVLFSGGKDSIAQFLHLLDEGVDRSKIELWHHDIDGQGERFMDWPCTTDYCRQFAQAFGVPIYFSWKHGGFLGEMLRENAPTQPTSFETPDGLVTVGGKGKPGTRLRFPQQAGDIAVRWCSGAVKIDVGDAALRNQKRFVGKRVLVLSGERAQESAQRAKYSPFEPDREDLRDGKKAPRHIDRWRAVHGWSADAVWAIMERYRVNPHPAYQMGWSRVSCMKCIFGGANQWASAAAIDPSGVATIELYEGLFGVTIDRGGNTVAQQIAQGTAYPAITDELAAQAMSEEYTQPIIVPQGEAWVMPAGAYSTERCGSV